MFSGGPLKPIGVRLGNKFMGEINLYDTGQNRQKSSGRFAIIRMELKICTYLEHIIKSKVLKVPIDPISAKKNIQSLKYKKKLFFFKKRKCFIIKIDQTKANSIKTHF